MVDIEKIRQKVNFIESNLVKLETLQAVNLEDFKNNFLYAEAAKYLLQVSIEAMIDIAHHIIARERYAAPTNSADAFQILCKQKIISEVNCKQYCLMARFRNRIVHVYTEIAPEEVYKIIQNNLVDFKSFLVEVTRFIQH